MATTTKYITSTIMVDLTNSAAVWDNGKSGDQRIELWVDHGAGYIWIETNGDPVTDQDDMVEMLVRNGVSLAAATDAVDCDFSGLK